MARSWSKTAWRVTYNLAAILLFLIWYHIASNYDYGALSGTYRFQDGGVSCKLVLQSNRSFHQELDDHGHKQAADGTWRRIGEGGAVFSSQFLHLPGVKSRVELWGPSADGDSEFDGHFERVGGIYPVLYIDGNSHSFHWTPFH